MAGVQVAGLVSGINWQNIITQLIQADSAGMNQVQASKNTVSTQMTAVGTISTDLANLENSVLDLQSPTLFSQVTAGSTDPSSTWSVSAQTGTASGSYQINFSHLATASALNGAGGISAGISPTSDVSGVTLANVNTAVAPTAGTFTVNGQQVTVSLTDSLQDVFDKISTATGGNVTGRYDPGTDKVTLTAGTGNVLLGAANDTSNFLQAFGLVNTGGSSTTSLSELGSLKLSNPVASAGLKTAVTAVDGSGNGSFQINGVAINYNVNTDSMATVLGRITNSTAGVAASYDAADDRIVLTNKTTGDTAINVSEASGGLLGALGLTTGTLARGDNALYSVNGGATQVSASNTLTPAALGISGLSVTADTTGTQTIQVQTDTTGMQNAIQSFITNFNALQTQITSDTRTTNSGGTVTTSLLSSDHDVAGWGSSLQLKAFGAGNGVGGVNGLDALGIDFDGTTGQLKISDSAKLQQALTSNTSNVAKFFQTGVTGFASVMSSAVIDTLSQQTAKTNAMQKQVTDYTNQIATMQNQLDVEQARLEAEFQAMENAEAQIQTQNSALSGFTGTSSSTGSSSFVSTNTGSSG